MAERTNHFMLLRVVRVLLTGWKPQEIPDTEQNGYSKKTDSSANAVIYANNQEIKTADTLKLLGVTIDSKLNFSEHASSACKMASQRIGVLMRLRNLILPYLTLPPSVAFL